jgi:flagellar hook-associated protein 1 FlgK
MSLFSALQSASNSLVAFENALTVTQNNVSNASTPGYVTQTPTFEALPFEQNTGASGGVTLGQVQSARNEYAEQSVQQATAQLGTYEQQVESLTNLQTQFDISGNTGVPAALSSLYSAFSNWASNPNDTTARQNVITNAQNLASAFQETAAGTSQIASNTNDQITALVNQVNGYTSQLATYNQQIQQGNASDPSLDAAIHSTLQSLSEIAGITATQQADGTYSVSLGGQINIVNGDHSNPLKTSIGMPTGTSVTSGNPVTTPVSIVAGVNDKLNLNIDGSNVPTITLSPSDTTAAAVVNDINTQLAAAGSTAKASQNSQGQLVIASGSSGANASVTVLSGTANSTLALSTSATPQMRLLDSNGNDVTNELQQGKLAAALSVANQALPSILGDASQTGSLNQMATSFANRVNTLVGANIFTYDPTNAANAAASLAVNPNMTAASLPGSQVVAVTGSAVTGPITITAGSNDSLNLNVDGKTWPTIALSPSDTSITSVAADLNSQFSTLGIGAQASVNASTGALVLSTTGTGNSASIQILSGSANATLGLTSTTPTYQNGANTAALNLANLENPQSSADEIGGQSYTAYFGSIAAGVGAQLSTATNNQSTQQDVVNQTEALRQQVSGVDLNTQATQIIQIQSAYEAASKVVTVIDSMTQTLLQLITPSSVV